MPNLSACEAAACRCLAFSKITKPVEADFTEVNRMKETGPPQLDAVISGPDGTGLADRHLVPSWQRLGIDNRTVHRVCVQARLPGVLCV